MKFDGAPLSTVAHCPESGIATNSDGVTQASQGNGQLWAVVDTAIVQTYASTVEEQHMGAAYRVVGAENLCHQAIFMDHASGAVAPPDAEVVQVGDAIGQETQRRGLVQGEGFQNGACG